MNTDVYYVVCINNEQHISRQTPKRLKIVLQNTEHLQQQNFSIAVADKKAPASKEKRMPIMIQRQCMQTM